MLHLPQGGMPLIQAQRISWEERKRKTTWRPFPLEENHGNHQGGQTDPEVASFMELHNISTGHAIELMGNYYSHNKAATTWEPTAEEESVELVNLDF